MASRENQGLHIALILLVMLTVGLCLVSYVFYSKAETQRGKAESAESQLTTARADLAKAGFKAQTLEKMITGQGKTMQEVADDLANIPGGEGDDPTMTQIRRSFENNMILFGPAAEAYDTARNYESLPAFLLSRIRDLNQQLSDLRRSEAQLTQEKTNLEQTSKKQFDDAQAALQKARDDLTSERDKFTKDLNDLRTNMEAIASQVAEKDNRLVELNTQIEEERKTTGKRIQDMASIIDNMRLEIDNLQQTSFEVPDAVITSVNQREGVLYIDVGSADNLNIQQTFSIFDKGTTGIMQAKPKGRIEVLQILGEHVALCRVLEDQLANIIMPGDLVFSPAWSPGQKIHIAIAGFVDVTGSGQNDVELLTKLIQINGGVVDDTVTPQTRYLVQGEDRSETPTGDTDQEMKDDFAQKMKAAIEIGVDRISIDKLLNLMGWRADVKTITLGTGKATAVEGASPDAVEKAGEAPAFRKRTPPRGSEGAF